MMPILQKLAHTTTNFFFIKDAQGCSWNHNIIGDFDFLTKVKFHTTLLYTHSYKMIIFFIPCPSYLISRGQGDTQTDRQTEYTVCMCFQNIPWFYNDIKCPKVMGVHLLVQMNVEYNLFKIITLMSKHNGNQEFKGHWIKKSLELPCTSFSATVCEIKGFASSTSVFKHVERVQGPH